MSPIFSLVSRGYQLAAGSGTFSTFRFNHRFMQRLASSAFIDDIEAKAVRSFPLIFRSTQLSQ